MHVGLWLCNLLWICVNNIIEQAIAFSIRIANVDSAHKEDKSARTFYMGV